MKKKSIKSDKFQGVYHYLLENGDKSYFITYRKDGKVKSKTIGTHSQGIREKYCYEMRIKFINEDEQESTNTLTLNELAEKYYNGNNKSDSKTKGRFDKYFKDNIGKKQLHEIDKSIIIEIDNQDISYASKNFLLGVLRALFNYAIEYEIYKGKNPFSNLRRPKPKNEREKYLTKDEVNALLTVVKPNDFLYLFVKLALISGGRLETVCNIQKSDFLEDGRLRLVDFKRDSMVYYGYYTEEVKELALSSKKDYVLQQTETLSYTSHKVQRELQPILNALFNSNAKGTKDRVVIHTLRHTFASHLAINSTPIYVIQKLMNHADINMTLRYAKLAPDSGKDAVRNLF